LLFWNEMLMGLKEKPNDLASCYNNVIMVHIQTMEIKPFKLKWIHITTQMKTNNFVNQWYGILSKLVSLV
jgi:hypothetical protein